MGIETPGWMEENRPFKVSEVVRDPQVESGVVHALFTGDVSQYLVPEGEKTDQYELRSVLKGLRTGSISESACLRLQAKAALPDFKSTLSLFEGDMNAANSFMEVANSIFHLRTIPFTAVIVDEKPPQDFSLLGIFRMVQRDYETPEEFLKALIERIDYLLEEIAAVRAKLNRAQEMGDKYPFTKEKAEAERKGLSTLEGEMNLLLRIRESDDFARALLYIYGWRERIHRQIRLLRLQAELEGSYDIDKKD